MIPDAKIETFLRGAHVFATSIKKILEEKYLAEATKNKLSFPQYNVLRLLESRKARHVGDVAEFLDISYPAASKIIERLHKMGYLTRREDPRDRRASCLEIASGGQDLIDRYEQHKMDSVRSVLSKMPPEQIELFGKMLEDMALHLLQDTPCYTQVCMQCGAYMADPCAIEAHVECAHRVPHSVMSFHDKR